MKLDAEIFMFHVVNILHNKNNLQVREATKIVISHWSYKTLIKTRSEKTINNITHDPYEVWADQILKDHYKCKA